MPKLTGPPTVLPERCSGCGRCVAACPQSIITLDTVNHRKTARIKTPETCTRCGACIASCLLKALVAPR